MDVFTSGETDASRPQGTVADGHLPAPRLLLLTPDFPPAHGGIQRWADRLASGLRGFDVRVVTLGAPGAGTFDRESGLHVTRVAMPGVLASSSPPARNAVLNLRALLSAARFRPELVLSLHLVTSPAAAAARVMFGARVVQFFHAQEIPAKRALAAFAANRADVVIAVSSYTAGLVEQTGAVPRTVRLIPPGCDLPTDASALPCERPTVLTVARLVDRYKGHDVLLRALAGVRAKIPDVELIVIGDGPLRAELEQLARSLALESNVRFLGAVSDAERDTWLRRASLLAMPSRLPGAGKAGEGFGIVYLEAGAYGKPVVAGNVGGALDAVCDGETGLLVDPTDPQAVGGAIVALLSDRALAERLGDGAARRAQELAWPRIIARVEDVLLEMLAEGPARMGGDRRNAAERGTG